ncbi:MAG: hypothetical protein U5R49_06475 [Deltaproteobacteria bacterium]|nr:hypothetical protein [Deltaproteobacteria bacterium]
MRGWGASPIEPEEIFEVARVSIALGSADYADREAESSKLKEVHNSTE